MTPDLRDVLEATDVERGVVVSFEIGWPQEPGQPLAVIAFPRTVGEA